MRDLFIGRDKRQALEWLARHRLVRNSFLCADCNAEFRLNKRESGIDDYRWQCSGCKKQRSVREGSFFSRSHLPLESIIIIMYGFARDFPQNIIAIEAGGLSGNTVVDWMSFCRDVCEQWLEDNSVEIGGLDENGEPKVVEIDESKFFHRKYHRGQWREGHWVFGGIERQSGKCFLVEVPDRKRETLEGMIRQYILPGTHIISDGWAPYAHIEELGNGIYTHDVIVHERHFVDPEDINIHTQNVENLWMRVKRKLRRQYGTSHALFSSYLHEFMWRNANKKFQLFSAFMSHVSSIYSFNIN